MKREINLTARFEINNELIKCLKKMINGKISYASPFICFDGITDEEADKVLSYLNTVGKYEIGLNLNYFTDSELMGFDFFYCNGQRKTDTCIDFIDFEFKMNGNASFDYTDYCPKCKEGLKQIAPFVVKGLSTKHASKKFVTPTSRYWIVSSELREKITHQNITGVDFWELLNYKGLASKTNFQMKPTKIVKNALDLRYVKTPDTGCNCKRGVGIPENTVKLHKESKSDLLDFTELYERNSSRIAGIYIISKKLLKLFIEEGIRPHWDVNIHPVEFV
ncbi:hypothetical protein [Treponema zioleckii]|uniref:hypothetical protein n=1 Tax=Treponema zioleckii TaxID=331680 RepID=UPI00168B283A|nr:hypothetical protein [Treponema zioleckii]